MYTRKHVLNQVLVNISTDYTLISQVYSQVEAQFVNMTSSLTDVISYISDQAVLDVTTNVGEVSEVFSTEFANVDSETISDKQETVYSFARDTKDEMLELDALLYAWSTIYSTTNQMTPNASDATSIYTTIVRTLQISTEAQIQEVAASLLTRDVVCFIAQTHYIDLTTYDHYNLTRMLQGNCGVTDAEWLEIYDDAKTGRHTALAAVEVQV